jgi:hypothetical protein
MRMSWFGFKMLQWKKGMQKMEMKRPNRPQEDGGSRSARKHQWYLPCVAKAGLTPSVGESIDKPTEEFKTRRDEFLGVYVGNKFKND